MIYQKRHVSLHLFQYSAKLKGKIAVKARSKTPNTAKRRHEMTEMKSREISIFICRKKESMKFPAL
ncbi:MAG TPA: hypothetical protein DDZ57_05885 [Porphyromonadaceae bacterium]|nr:hypothetical protein [Porphyromonadaceae bacterium]